MLVDDMELETAIGMIQIPFCEDFLKKDHRWSSGDHFGPFYTWRKET